MGVLPLCLPEGWGASAMRISPRDVVEIDLDFNALAACKGSGHASAH
jgi:hypothetical protein